METLAWSRKGGCSTAPLSTLLAGSEWESREAFVRSPREESPEVLIEEREVAEKRCREIGSGGRSSGTLVIFTD